MSYLIEMERSLGKVVSGFSPRELLQTYEDVLMKLAAALEEKDRLDMEIYRRMSDRGSKTIPNADENGEQIWLCEKKEDFEYDHSQFIPVKERLNQTELEACYSEPYEYTQTVEVPGKFNTQKLKAVAADHGDGLPEMVANARILKRRSITFKRIER